LFSSTTDLLPSSAVWVDGAHETRGVQAKARKGK
jgi:hypothetical protein